MSDNIRDSENEITETKPASKRRRYVLLIFAVLLLGSGLGYRHFWLSRPIGSGPAGPTVDRSLFAEVWSERPVLLVGLGDSVTAGFGATPGHSYFERLIANPADDSPDMQGVTLKRVLPNLKSRNIALSGTTSLECLEMLIPKLPVQDERTVGLVVLTTGGNDIIHNYGRTPPREGAMYGATTKQAKPWIDNFQSRLAKILEEINVRFPAGCQIFIANIYDPTDGVGDAQNAGLPRWNDGLSIIHRYNLVIEEAANRNDNVHLVDMHAEFLGHGIHCTKFWAKHYNNADPHYWYFDNLEDPNDRGYDAIRRLFLLRIAEVFPDALDSPASPQLRD